MERTINGPIGATVESEVFIVGFDVGNCVFVRASATLVLNSTMGHVVTSPSFLGWAAFSFRGPVPMLFSKEGVDRQVQGLTVLQGLRRERRPIVVTVGLQNFIAVGSVVCV